MKNPTPKQNPFSPYDFIGLFIPGGLFWLLIVLIDHELLNNFLLKGLNIVDGLGHICKEFTPISFISSILMLIVIYVTGHVISLLSNIILEESTMCLHDDKLAKKFFENIEKTKLEPTKQEPKIIKSFLIFMKIWEIILVKFGMRGEKLSHAADIDSLRKEIFNNTASKILEKYKNIDNLNRGVIEDSGNKFELVHHYVLHRGDSHMVKIQNYVALYGFSRNVCMVFNMFAWITLGAVIYYMFMCAIDFQSSNIPCAFKSIILTLTCSFSGFVMLCGFNKFRRRYTLEILHAAASILLDEDQRDNPKKVKGNY